MVVLFSGYILFFKKDFLLWTFFLKRSTTFLLNLLQYCFCFMFWSFGPKACWILVPWPGIHNVPPALEGKILTTGPPGKSYDSMLQSSCHPPRLALMKSRLPLSVCVYFFTSWPPSPPTFSPQSACLLLPWDWLQAPLHLTLGLQPKFLRSTTHTEASMRPVVSSK